MTFSPGTDSDTNGRGLAQKRKHFCAKAHAFGLDDGGGGGGAGYNTDKK
jgi:hypothetical protein